MLWWRAARPTAQCHGPGQIPLNQRVLLLQAECRRQNVTARIEKLTVLANSTTVRHVFVTGQSQGNVFGNITVTHLANPTQVQTHGTQVHHTTAHMHALERV